MMWAIIGSSGFDRLPGVDILETLPSDTPFGMASSGLKRIRIHSHECLFLPCHGESHELLPSEVNHRANIFVLKKFGATKCISLGTVESLHPDCLVGDVVIPSQYINLTHSRQPVSFCGNGVVGHVSLANPIWEAGAQCVRSHHEQLGFAVHFDRTYLCAEGPCLPTMAESKLYHRLGADIVGMTAFPEYALAREAGLCYLPCCFIAPSAQWSKEECEGEEAEVPYGTLIQKRAFQLTKILFDRSPEEDGECREGGLKVGLKTEWESIDRAHRTWLEIILN